MGTARIDMIAHMNCVTNLDEILGCAMKLGTLSVLTGGIPKLDVDFWERMVSLTVNKVGNIFICVNKDEKHRLSNHVKIPPPNKKIIIGESLDGIEELLTSQNIKSLIVHNESINFDSMFKLRNLSLDYAVSVLVITDKQREEEPNTFFADIVL